MTAFGRKLAPAIALAALGAAGITVSLTQGGTAQAATTPPIAKPTVYQAMAVNQKTVLGPQYAPTTLAATAALPAGLYLVTSVAGAVIASHDQIVCSASGSGNDGVFGTAGNPGTGSIYGTATMTDAIRVQAGQTIKLVCNSFTFGLGTYVTTAVIEAIPVAAVR
ncbi:hypothetical protein M6D93_15155 [Jatrophihabitans telluris]|uniref:Uncharacterized protein n=1 Tax=Jatrophihabitans telluris TaxID=2038343 RepID=A0ABY4QWE1_9ACTN|nr:hypothetical protein [Jatrophihabitans telluris]UQX87629.1 hypothetical protein M6D93_15155 [Jatrophihabitans telluris]